MDYYGGAGVQHIAIRTNDIIKTVSLDRLVKKLPLRSSCFNQSAALLFSEGDHDLPRISRSFVAFSTSVTRPTFSHFVSPSNIFPRCLPLLSFPSIIPVVTSCSSLYLFLTWSRRIAWPLRAGILFIIVMLGSYNSFVRIRSRS